MECRRIVQSPKSLKIFLNHKPFPAPAPLNLHAPAEATRPFEVSLVILPLFLLGFLVARFAAPLFKLLPACAFRQVTGVPCPSCGATRAGLALAQGNLMTALSYNPLFVLGLGVLFGWSVYRVFEIWSGRPVAGGLVKQMMKTFGVHSVGAALNVRRRRRWLAVGAIAVNWLYLIITT